MAEKNLFSVGYSKIPSSNFDKILIEQADYDEYEGVLTRAEITKAILRMSYSARSGFSIFIPSIPCSSDGAGGILTGAFVYLEDPSIDYKLFSTSCVVGRPTIEDFLVEDELLQFKNTREEKFKYPCHKLEKLEWKGKTVIKDDSGDSLVEIPRPGYVQTTTGITLDESVYTVAKVSYRTTRHAYDIILPIEVLKYTDEPAAIVFAVHDEGIVYEPFNIPSSAVGEDDYSCGKVIININPPDKTPRHPEETYTELVERNYCDQKILYKVII